MGQSQSLLSSQFSEEELKTVLIPRDQWKPAPGLEDRGDWENLPEEVKDLYLSVAEDEKHLSLAQRNRILFVYSYRERILSRTSGSG